MSTRDDHARRTALRAQWPGGLTSLGAVPEAVDLRATTTPEQRVGMLWELTLGVWSLTGRPLPDYPRTAMPGRLVRR